MFKKNEKFVLVNCSDERSLKKAGDQMLYLQWLKKGECALFTTVELPNSCGAHFNPYKNHMYIEGNLRDLGIGVATGLYQTRAYCWNTPVVESFELADDRVLTITAQNTTYVFAKY